jgi:hypothetical protein
MKGRYQLFEELILAKLVFFSGSVLLGHECFCND